MRPLLVFMLGATLVVMSAGCRRLKFLPALAKAAKSNSSGVRTVVDPAEEMVERGFELLEKKDYDRALREFNKALSTNPISAPAYLGRGEVYYAKKQYAAALTDYRKAVFHDYTMEEAHNSLAWALATCPDAAFRNGKEAIEHAGIAQLRDGDDPDYKDTLAAAYAEAGNFEEAVRWEKEALKHVDLTPEDRREFENRLMLYERGHPFRE